MALAFEPAAKHNSNFELVPEIENKNLKKKLSVKNMTPRSGVGLNCTTVLKIENKNSSFFSLFFVCFIDKETLIAING
jgi:hypothetical protein